MKVLLILVLLLINGTNSIELYSMLQRGLEKVKDSFGLFGWSTENPSPTKDTFSTRMAESNDKKIYYRGVPNNVSDINSIINKPPVDFDIYQNRIRRNRTITTSVKLRRPQRPVARYPETIKTKRMNQYLKPQFNPSNFQIPKPTLDHNLNRNLNLNQTQNINPQKNIVANNIMENTPTNKNKDFNLDGTLKPAKEVPSSTEPSNKNKDFNLDATLEPAEEVPSSTEPSNKNKDFNLNATLDPAEEVPSSTEPSNSNHNDDIGKDLIQKEKNPELLASLPEERNVTKRKYYIVTRYNKKTPWKKDRFLGVREMIQNQVIHYQLWRQKKEDNVTLELVSPDEAKEIWNQSAAYKQNDSSAIKNIPEKINKLLYGKSDEKILLPGLLNSVPMLENVPKPTDPPKEGFKEMTDIGITSSTPTSTHRPHFSKYHSKADPRREIVKKRKNHHKLHGRKSNETSSEVVPGIKEEIGVTKEIPQNIEFNIPKSGRRSSVPPQLINDNNTLFNKTATDVPREKYKPKMRPQGITRYRPQGYSGLAPHPPDNPLKPNDRAINSNYLTPVTDDFENEEDLQAYLLPLDIIK